MEKSYNEEKYIKAHPKSLPPILINNIIPQMKNCVKLHIRKIINENIINKEYITKNKKIFLIMKIFLKL